jgi:hypothetical protein
MTVISGSITDCLQHKHLSRCLTRWMALVPDHERFVDFVTSTSATSRTEIIIFEMFNVFQPLQTILPTGKMRKNYTSHPYIEARWAVYTVAMENEGYKGCVYIGSATNLRRSQRTLVKVSQLHQRHEARTPSLFGKLLIRYLIIYNGVLVSCPTPSIADVPHLCLLVVTMEAMLSFHFWTMKSATIFRLRRRSCCF